MKNCELEYPISGLYPVRGPGARGLRAHVLCKYTPFGAIQMCAQKERCLPDRLAEENANLLRVTNG